MRRWFLSYNSQDLAFMQVFESALKRKDPDATFFFAPKSLRAGGFWLPQLAKEIADATAFVLLVGEKGVGPWQVIEYYEAFDRRAKQSDFPLIVVLLDGQPAPGLEFLRQLHWIFTADPSSEAVLAKVLEAAAGGGVPPGELWRHTAPYRGLAAMTESDTEFFFGRSRETTEVIDALVTAPDRLVLLLGNSGVGKSSIAQAGVVAALKRQSLPENYRSTHGWPIQLGHSRRWCYVKLNPGVDPLKALVEPFVGIWQFDATDPRWEEKRTEWVDRLLNGKASLSGLLDATERRYEELGQPKPPAFLVYIDQGEELYSRAERRHRQRFSEVLAHGLADPRLHGLMSLRADFFGELQSDEPLYAVHRQVNVPPLREADLRLVVSRPAELLSARFETDRLAADIAQRAAEESAKDAGALPLLSYLLDDMWTQMVERGDGMLRMPPQAIEFGGVLVRRADAFLALHPNSEEQLRRIFTLKLATVREDGEPTRRRALRTECSDEEWRLVTELADSPNRLLVTATMDAGQTYVEVAHEAIFRRWDRLRDWIAAEREFLAWRSGLEASRRSWQATPDRSKHDALLVGFALAKARSWCAKRPADLSAADRHFIELSVTHDRHRKWQTRAVVGALLFLVVVLGAWSSQSYLQDRIHWYTIVRPYMLKNVRPYVLTPAAERALKPGDTFKECAKDCPEMVTLPPGTFVMGAPPGQVEYNEQHTVTIPRSFAVSKFDVTFEQWDACVAAGGCDGYKPADQTWGRDTRPVINVNFKDVHQYVAWFSQLTGKPYRLLSEAEWEYAARAGTNSAYPWGDEIGIGNANCAGCDRQWGGTQTAPVGQFRPNGFGLYDMHGNVFSWIEDCYRRNYDGAPTDGSVDTRGNCDQRVVRGGSWNYGKERARSANRMWQSIGSRNSLLGLRVARTLSR